MVSDPPNHGIYVKGGDSDVTIQNCTFHNNWKQDEDAPLVIYDATVGMDRAALFSHAEDAAAVVALASQLAEARKALEEIAESKVDEYALREIARARLKAITQ